MIKYIILGLIQGITEWLPISSSGHLAIIQYFFEIQEPLFFDVMLHVSSLLVLFVVFKKEILWVLNLKNKESRKYFLLLVLGSIPAAIVGILFYKAITYAFSSLLFVSVSLLITGMFLYLTKFVRTGKQEINKKDAIMIGFAQALALLPGISRSGVTVSTGLLSGNKKQESARFAFLLAIPALIGAGVYELLKNSNNLINISWTSVLVGMFVSFVVGLVSITLLLKILYRGKLHYFSYYCFLLGIVILLLYFLGI